MACIQSNHVWLVDGHDETTTAPSQSTANTRHHVLSKFCVGSPCIEVTTLLLGANGLHIGRRPPTFCCRIMMELSRTPPSTPPHLSRPFYVFFYILLPQSCMRGLRLSFSRGRFPSASPACCYMKVPSRLGDSSALPPFFHGSLSISLGVYACNDAQPDLP